MAPKGVLLGLVFGFLLDTGMLVIENWEQLCSVVGFSFIAFWNAFGVAYGVMVILDLGR